MPRSCIFLLLDGARPEVLARLAKEGKLPNIAEHFYARGHVSEATTCFPSTTGPAYFPFLLGQLPGQVNVPGIRWLDRQHFKSAWFNGKGRRSYVGWESFYFNSDLAQHLPTLYEEFGGYAVGSIVKRGATAENGVLAALEPLAMFYAKLSHHWSVVDRMATHRVLRLLAKKPSFVFCAFLGIDEQSHLTSPFSKATEKAYVQVDASIGRLFAELKRESLLEDTLVLASSDHGLTETQRHLELWQAIEQRGRKTFYYPNVFRRNCQAACMVSGNAMAHLYFSRQGNWGESMRHEDLEAEAWIEHLLAYAEVDQLLSKDGHGNVWVSSAKGQAKIKLSADQVAYEVVRNQDPFGFGALPATMTWREALELTWHSDYPDALVQAAQVFASPRCGDLLVTAKLGSDLRKRFEIPAHHASHGSLHAEHMRVPVLSNQALPSRCLRTLDLHQMMRDHLAQNLRT